MLMLMRRFNKCSYILLYLFLYYFRHHTVFILLQIILYFYMEYESEINKYAFIIYKVVNKRFR